MPVVRIDITGPKSAEWKRALLEGARAAVVSGLGAPDGRVTVRVVETPDDCVDIPDCRTRDFTVVEVLMYEGRTEEMKRAFVARLRETLAANPGIPPSEITVVLRDYSTLDLDVLPGEAGGGS
jgi:phenylpyruvate tautomerase PptA (4-oxalocrotonate tautomerase family)